VNRVAVVLDALPSRDRAVRVRASLRRLFPDEIPRLLDVRLPRADVTIVEALKRVRREFRRQATGGAEREQHDETEHAACCRGHETLQSLICDRLRSRRHGRPHDVRQAVQFPSETLEPTALPDNGKKGNASCTAGTSGNPCKTSEIASFPELI